MTMILFWMIIIVSVWILFGLCNILVVLFESWNEGVDVTLGELCSILVKFIILGPIGTLAFLMSLVFQWLNISPNKVLIRGRRM
jgi:hypothetical protein